ETGLRVHDVIGELGLADRAGRVADRALMALVAVLLPVSVLRPEIGGALDVLELGARNRVDPAGLREIGLVGGEILFHRRVQLHRGQPAQDLVPRADERLEVRLRPLREGIDAGELVDRGRHLDQGDHAAGASSRPIFASAAPIGSRNAWPDAVAWSAACASRMAPSKYRRVAGCRLCGREWNLSVTSA